MSIGLAVQSAYYGAQAKVCYMGPKLRKKVKKSEEYVKRYTGKLNGDQMVSNKEDLYLIPQIEFPETTDKNRFEKYNQIGRSYDGFLMACHVFAVLSEKEPVYNIYLLDSHKKAVNAICDYLEVEKLYKQTLDKNEYTLDDFGIDNPDKAIITIETLQEAYRRYPVESLKDKIFSEMKEFKTEEELIEECMTDSTKAEVIKDAEVVSTETEAVVEVDPEVYVDINETSVITPEPSEGVKEEEVLTPIIFDNNKLNLFGTEEVVADKDLTKTQNEKFAELFGELLKDKNYQLNRVPSGAIELVIHESDGSFKVIWVDPNLAIGNGYNIIGRFETGDIRNPIDTVMVHESETEIIKKIFEDPTTPLTPEEIQRCMSHMFINQRIYNVIDMSNMSGRLKKLSPEEFSKLGKKLTFIINALKTYEIGRLRFIEWKSIDDFKLVSDQKCKAPFPAQMMTNITGVEVSVGGDRITIDYNGNITNLVIQNYGEI